MIRFFDSHAHVYDKAYDGTREQMLKDVFRSVDYLVCPSEDLETSRLSVSLAQAYPGIYAAVGFHPHRAAGMTEEALSDIEEMAQSSPKVVAIGEIGLDYFRLKSEKEDQLSCFERQLALADIVDLPVIIHARDSFGDTLAVLKKHKSPRLRGVIHCFSGSYEMAKELIKLGFYISFAGSVVFPGSVRLKAVAKQIPLERLLIETDSPYLTPPPFRGRINTPVHVSLVAEELARLKECSVETIAKATYDNACTLFQLKK